MSYKIVGKLPDGSEVQLDTDTRFKWAKKVATSWINDEKTQLYSKVTITDIGTGKIEYEKMKKPHKVKPKSRATRCGDAVSVVQEISGQLEDLKSEVEEAQGLTAEDLGLDPTDPEAEAKLKTALDVKLEEAKTRFKEIMSNFGWDEFESLKDEIDSWKSNMEGTSLENTSKYETLSECVDNLESAISDFEQIETDASDATDLDDLVSRIDDNISNIDSGVSNAESCEFPGMYG